MRIRQLGKAVAAVAVLVGLSGCASIPQRAWDNGRGMTHSNAYRSMMRGERGFHVARSLYSSMDPYRSLYTPVPYAPFGRW
jgi:hypothetical protein